MTPGDVGKLSTTARPINQPGATPMSALSTAARNEYYGELEKSLPTPVINQPEYRERRLATAVEAFEALRPGDAYEGRLAVRIVLCGAYAAECLREADCYRDNYAKRTHCRAQAASMMRGENSAKRMLEREQRVRLAAEAVTGGGRRHSQRGWLPHRHTTNRKRRRKRRPWRCRRPGRRGVVAVRRNSGRCCAARRRATGSGGASPGRPPGRAGASAARVRPAALARGDRPGRGLCDGGGRGRGAESATTAASRRRARRISTA